MLTSAPSTGGVFAPVSPMVNRVESEFHIFSSPLPPVLIVTLMFRFAGLRLASETRTIGLLKSGSVMTVFAPSKPPTLGNAAGVGPQPPAGAPGT